MIEVTKINGKPVFVNPDLIRFLESAGDTVVVFVDGEKILVLQTPQEVIDRVVEFRRRCAHAPMKSPPIEKAA